MSMRLAELADFFSEGFSMCFYVSRSLRGETTLRWSWKTYPLEHVGCIAVGAYYFSSLSCTSGASGVFENVYVSFFWSIFSRSAHCHKYHTLSELFLRSQLGGSKALRGALRGFKNLGLFEAVNSSGEFDDWVWWIFMDDLGTCWKNLKRLEFDSCFACFQKYLDRLQVAPHLRVTKG